ncbi:P-II family nitrogen regulator [Mobiluncus mulieris]|uniref:Nitrogen regulatory protein P-II n=2 Tax=Mobiluncus mulieris TaxID=2052 RepID=E0QNU5_9ACTO|nr:P-II family nitrogen regulator [Mobiluncus mulieris]EEJ52894.1 putative nitrogen regulatory protein P-II [Mobiluncus mulieris ATCC 35243]EEZ92191.1 putative nitrogen regulatory protein P-II [Mobiluncus mulieris 28-1]EFM46841.1 putative nitrogen regulatory protein P-II [Mobiluncus mulieris ATCC 35239]EFN92512.1 putative nitrogen regulatory protein P-II [Mobiluncus mulieris FB024-16]MBB5847024.1 nitrogen regulatory protein PII [Mobiluncus mulieris]
MHQVILTIVEKGRAEAVIDAAVKAGSHGGSIINARGSGVHETASLFGFSVEPEKELVLILAEDTRVRDIVAQISTDLRLDEPGNGIVFVQDLARVRGLYQANG